MIQIFHTIPCHYGIMFGSDESSSEQEVQATGARGWNDLDDDSDDESVSLPNNHEAYFFASQEFIKFFTNSVYIIGI